MNMVATERLYLTEDQKKVVPAGHKDAATLYAAIGDEIPESACELFGLADGGIKRRRSAETSVPKTPAKKTAAKKTATKRRTKSAAGKAGQNKGGKPEGDKSKDGDDDKSGSADGNKGKTPDEDKGGLTINAGSEANA